MPNATNTLDCFKPDSIHIKIKGKTATNANVLDKYHDTAFPEK